MDQFQSVRNKSLGLTSHAEKFMSPEPFSNFPKLIQQP